MKVVVHFKDTSTINIQSQPSSEGSGGPGRGESWGQLCQRLVETKLLHPPRLLQLLNSLHPHGGRYQFRYGDGGNATVIRPTWNTDLRIVKGGEECGLVDANIMLRPRGGALCEEQGLMQIEVPDSSEQVDVDFCVEKVGVTAGGNRSFPFTQTPFPVNDSRASVLFLKEHVQFVGVVDKFSISRANTQNGTRATAAATGSYSESCADVAAPACFKSPPAGASRDYLANAHIDSDGNGNCSVAAVKGPVGTRQNNSFEREAIAYDGAYLHSDGNYRKVPPEWIFPHLSLHAMYLYWHCGDNQAKNKVPPMKYIFPKDLKHLGRAAERNQSYLKLIMGVIDKAAEANGKMPQRLMTQAEASACFFAGQHGIQIEQETSTGKHRQIGKMSWRTVLSLMQAKKRKSAA